MMNSNDSSNPSSQDSELSFSEKSRKSKSSQRSHSRYHFLVETDDGEGISLCENELKSYLENKKTIQRPEQPAYLMETEDGFLVRVPFNKLDSWIEAQQSPPRPLTPGEKLVCNRIVTNIYGQDSNQSSVSSSEAPPPPFKEVPVSSGPIKKVRRSAILLWILSVLLVCVSALALFFAFRSASLESSLSKTMSDLEQSISKCQAVSNARDQLRDTVYQYSDEINFWRSSVVIVTEFGEKYHTYGCQYIQDSDTLWFMNVGVARLRGYEACSVCSPAIPPY